MKDKTQKKRKKIKIKDRIAQTALYQTNAAGIEYIEGVTEADSNDYRVQLALDIDLRDETAKLFVDHDHTSSGISMAVWEGLVRRYSSQNLYEGGLLDENAIDRLLRNLTPLVNELLAEADINYDTANPRGNLTPEGDDVSYEIEKLMQDVDWIDTDVRVASVEDLLDEEEWQYIRDCTTIKEYAEDCWDNVHTIAVGDQEDFEEHMERLRERYEDNEG